MKINLCIGLVGLMFAVSGNATTVLYQNFNQLIDNSEHIVGGTVEDVKSTHSGNKVSKIYTVLTLKKAYVIKSSGKVDLRKKVKLRYEGGTIDIKDKDNNLIGRQGSIAHGTPNFEPGEKVILFVKQNGISSMPFIGWGQGVFRVSEYDELMDQEKNPVVGIQGSDLIVRTEKGLNIGGRLIDKSVVSNLKERLPTLLGSDGGIDTLITKESIKEDVENIMGLVNAMNASDFESMIEERIAEMEFKALKPKTNGDVASLFDLPSPSPEIEVHKPIVAPNAAAQKFSDRTEILERDVPNEPVLPLQAPE